MTRKHHPQCAVFLIPLLIGIITNLSFATDIDKWRNMVQAETLDVFLGGTCVGTLSHATTLNDSNATVTVKTNLLVNAPAAGGKTKMGMSLAENRVFDMHGDLLSAYQELTGESGQNSWKLCRDSLGWQVLIFVGGIQTKRRVANINENLSATNDLYTKVKLATVKVGEVFCDTVFELVSQKNIVSTYTCTAIDPIRKKYTFSAVDNMVGALQKWELDSLAKTIMQEIEGVFIARNKKYGNTQKSTGVHSGSSDITTIFSIDKASKPNPNEQIVLSFSKDLTPDSSVLPFYVLQNGKFILKDTMLFCQNQSTPVIDTTTSEWLKSTVSIQSDFPAIVSLGKNLKASRIDACKIIDTVNQYVFKSLDKRNTATFSSAVETLKAGYGDCSEHSVLLCAILRSIGIPARVVLGLLYYEPKKAFVGHAWVMAFTGDTWVYADPAFGSFPANRNRIPLVLDDTGAQGILLTKYIGHIKIDYSKSNNVLSTKNNNKTF